jgi:hypothetical protein
MGQLFVPRAHPHFEKIGTGLVAYDKADTYKTLLDKVMR